jgi:hypothetical protein
VLPTLVLGRGYDAQVFGALAKCDLVGPYGFGLSDTGREAVEEIEEWLRTGRARLGDWVSEEQELAYTYTSGAGATILLMDDLYPEFALVD